MMPGPSANDETVWRDKNRRIVQEWWIFLPLSRESVLVTKVRWDKTSFSGSLTEARDDYCLSIVSVGKQLDRVQRKKGGNEKNWRRPREWYMEWNVGMKLPGWEQESTQ